MPLSGVLERFFNYWSNLPKAVDGLLPVKFDMLPSELQDIMPRVTLLKRVHRYQVNVCLMRTTSDTSWHTPFVGMNAFDLTASSMRENSAKLYAAILDHPAGAMLTEKLPHGAGRVVSLYLPLSDTAGCNSYIVGCSVCEDGKNLNKINGRLLPDYQQISSVAFVDIGAGMPKVDFENRYPNRTRQENPRPQWWSRFIPASPEMHKLKRYQEAEPENIWVVTSGQDFNDNNGKLVRH